MITNFKDTSIIIERFTSTQNSFGEPVEVWVTHITIQGRISPKTSKERFESAKTTLFSDHTLYCDFADIKETDRVVVGTDIYRITGVITRKKPKTNIGFMEIDLLAVK